MNIDRGEEGILVCAGTILLAMPKFTRKRFKPFLLVWIQMPLIILKSRQRTKPVTGKFTTSIEIITIVNINSGAVHGAVVADSTEATAKAKAKKE
jgi:hypothetical protein